jgi:thioesterase domain-containing protein
VRRSGPVVLHEHGDEPPIWVVAGAGATALACRALADCLGPAHPLIVLEAAGMHDGRRPHDTVEDEAADHVRAVVRARTAAGTTPDEPVRLAGHSWGGLVAYEMAVQLDRAGVPVSVFLIDTGKPRPAPKARRQWRVGLRSRLRRATARRAGTRAHYDRFERRGNASGARYEVPRSTFPVTLGLAEQSTAADLWRTRAAQLRVVQLTGSHNGVMLPPDVALLAEEMTAAFGPGVRSG